MFINYLRKLLAPVCFARASWIFYFVLFAVLVN